MPWVGFGQWWLSRVDNLVYHPQHRAWLFLLHRKSIVHSPCLSLYFRPIQNTKIRAWACSFCNNPFVCEQMTTFSPFILVSAQLLNFLLFLQNEFAAKYRQILTRITGRNSEISSESSTESSFMKSVSQFVLSLTIERLLGNPQLSPVVMAMEDRWNYFPPNSVVI